MRLIAFLLWLLPCGLWAEFIFLDDGRIIQGKVISRNQSSVILDDGSAIGLNRILKIHYGKSFKWISFSTKAGGNFSGFLVKQNETESSFIIEGKVANFANEDIIVTKTEKRTTVEPAAAFAGPTNRFTGAKFGAALGPFSDLYHPSFAVFYYHSVYQELYLGWETQLLIAKEAAEGTFGFLNNPGLAYILPSPFQRFRLIVTAGPSFSSINNNGQWFTSVGFYSQVMAEVSLPLGPNRLGLSPYVGHLVQKKTTTPKLV